MVIENGDRIVKTHSKSIYPKSTVHCFGSCLCFGLCNRDGFTIQDEIQRSLNEKHISASVKNHGLRNGKYLRRIFKPSATLQVFAV
jgi:hypothetical protein